MNIHAQPMKHNSAMKHTLTLLTALLLTPLAARAQLNVVNGDFSDLSGLTQGQDGWHAGLPKGWQGSGNHYAVDTKRGATPPTCNPSTLGFLRQNVGVLDKAADVMLTFDVSAPWQSKDVLLSVSLLTGDLLELTAGDFQPGAKQKLVARNVPAGTSVVLAFQAVRATPGLDNVAVSVEPATSPAPVTSPVATAGRRITVASYYFGNYHPGDPRNTKNKGPDWSEWELVKAAKPRFPGHQQPRVPLWGYGDESDPKVMEQKIAAAADHGIDAFIFDWYPFTNTISGNTPDRFREAMEMTKRRLLAKPGGPRILNINCWNEWTEGSYLEPDTVNGMKYLEAVRDVFGTPPKAK